MPAAIAPTAPSSPSIAAPFPRSLLEAEFFGARRARTPAPRQDREGYFQAARGGTLFLDEIGDLPLAMQSKLLRAIQERQVRSLGSTQEDAVDVRIVSATHKDLAADVHAGRFRQDLYYRLNVIEILVPPLRERREDLPALCEALLARIAQDSGMPVPVLSPPVLQQLCDAPAAAAMCASWRTCCTAPWRCPTARSCRWISRRPRRRRAAPTCAGAPPAAPLAAAPAGRACRSQCPRDLQAYLDQQEREILVQGAARKRLQPHRRRAAAGPVLRQIRYRIARLAIAAPGGDEPQ